jgi:uncharacterized protein (UPF0333 family)
MRVLITVVVVAALGLAVYFLTQGAPEDMEDAATAVESTTEEAVEEAVEEAGDAADAVERGRGRGHDRRRGGRRRRHDCR